MSWPRKATRRPTSASGTSMASPLGVHATDWETDTELSCIDGFTKPCALMLSWSTPHNPYHQLPERWYRVYDPERLKLPPNTSDMPENRRDLAGYYAHQCPRRVLGSSAGWSRRTWFGPGHDRGLHLRSRTTHTSVRDTDGPWLLYDNTKDPDQLKNLVDEPAAAEVRASLDAELEGWLLRLGDPFRDAAYYVERYGYDVEAGRAAPHTYDLDTALPSPVGASTRRAIGIGAGPSIPFVRYPALA